MSSHLVIAPVLLPFLAGVLLLAVRDMPMPLRRLIGVAAALAQIGIAALLLQAVSGGEILVYRLGDWPAPWGIVLVADRLSALMVLITALLACFALLYTGGGVDRPGRHFHVLFQMQLFGLSGAFLTGDLFNLFVFFEVLLISSYGLQLHGGGAARVRAGLHYVVLNLLGSSVFLIAAGLFYGVLGTLNLADLAVRVASVAPEDAGLARVAGLLLLAVFALKAALLPLHLWLPAAYGNAPAPVAALFAIMTKLGAYAILRVHTLVFGSGAGGGTAGAVSDATGGPLADLFAPWLMPLALATLLIGMFGALAAQRIGQQAGYLVVASVGTLLVAFGIGSTAGIAAGLYYLPHSTFAAAALFLLGDAIARRRPAVGDALRTAVDLPQAAFWGGLFFAVAVLIAGLPPLSGFLGKFMILRAALDHALVAWIWSLVLVTALVGLVALARSGSLLFLRATPAATLLPPQSSGESGSDLRPRWWEVLPLSGLLLLSLGLTVFGGPVSDFAQQTAAQLLQPAGYIAAVLGGGR